MVCKPGTGTDYTSSLNSKASTLYFELRVDAKPSLFSTAYSFTGVRSTTVLLLMTDGPNGDLDWLDFVRRPAFYFDFALTSRTFVEHIQLLVFADFYFSRPLSTFPFQPSLY